MPVIEKNICLTGCRIGMVSFRFLQPVVNIFGVGLLDVFSLRFNVDSEVLVKSVFIYLPDVVLVT